MLGADVRGEDRSTDYHPAGVAARQEIIDLVFLMPPIPPGYPADDAEVDKDDDPVDRSEPGLLDQVGGGTACGGISRTLHGEPYLTLNL